MPTRRTPKRWIRCRSTECRGSRCRGYRVGLTIAPIMPIPHCREGYRSLLQDVASAVSDLPGADPTVECITHRFTAGSKDVLLGWYPEQSWRWTSRRAPASSASTAPPSTSIREKSWPSCGPGSKASWPQRFPRLVLFIGRSRLRLLLDLFERKPGAARAKETDVEA